MKRKKYLDASMGCLKLSYYEIESCLPEASPLRISYVNGEVREEKECRFLGVVNQQTNGSGHTMDTYPATDAIDFANDIGDGHTCEMFYQMCTHKTHMARMS